MPTYEYRCPDGHEFEVFQRISEEPGADCPECGQPAQRMISAGAGFLFKGDGFYITDYRSSEYKKKAASEGKPSGSESGSASGGSEGGGSASDAGSSSGSSAGAGE